MTATNEQLESGLGVLLNETQYRQIRLSGTADPSVGAGVAAPRGVQYDRLDGSGNVISVWKKSTAANTGWTVVGAGGGGGSAAATTFDDTGLPITAANVQVALQETLKRTGLAGTWDMTPIDVDATPDAAYNQEMTVASVPEVSCNYPLDDDGTFAASQGSDFAGPAVGPNQQGLSFTSVTALQQYMLFPMNPTSTARFSRPASGPAAVFEFDYAGGTVDDAALMILVTDAAGTILDFATVGGNTAALIAMSVAADGTVSGFKDGVPVAPSWGTSVRTIGATDKYAFGISIYSGVSGQTASGTVHSVSTDMAGTYVAGETDPCGGGIESPAISTARYAATPVTGTSLVKLAGSTLIKKETASRSARLRASTNGGNFVLSMIVFANHDATVADVSASILGSKVGTCTHIAALFLDNNAAVGAGAYKLAMRTDDPVLGNRTQTIIGAGAYVALDQVYCTFNGTTGLFSASVNAGAPVAGTNVFDVSGTTALRMYVAAYHTANPPTMTDAAYDFDFSDNTGGRTGFKTINDPAVPSDAADSKRYLVSAPGPYRGRSASSGDIVEFHTGMTAIQILPATPWTTALTQALINPYITANPSAVQEIIDASLASYIPPTVEFDIETEYASLGGAAPGEFQLSAATVGATFWSTNLAGSFTLLTTYAAGYTPVAGDTFYMQFASTSQTVAISTAGGDAFLTATDWSLAGNVATFMKTPYKRYQFVFVDAGASEYWVLMNPDYLAWTDGALSGSPLVVAGFTGGAYGRPGTTLPVSSTGDGLIKIPLTTGLSGVEPLHIGQSCRLTVGTNTTRIRIIGDSAGAGGITFTSNLTVQSITVGAISENAVDIIGSGHAVTVTRIGAEAWHIFAPSAERPAVGRLYMEGNATGTTIAVPGTYYKVAGTTIPAPLTSEFTHSDNRLLTSLSNKMVEINVSVSVVSGAADQVFGVMVAKNGVTVPGSKMRGKVLSIGSPTALAISLVESVVSTDYFEVFITNETAGNALTVQDMQMTISRMQ